MPRVNSAFLSTLLWGLVPHTEEQMRRYLGLKNGENYIIRGFIICNYRQYMSGDKTNVDVMDGNIHSYRRLV